VCDLAVFFLFLCFGQSSYGPQELDADITQVEHLMERIIRSVDTREPAFHQMVKPLYDRLTICLEGSYKVWSPFSTLFIIFKIPLDVFNACTLVKNLMLSFS
jgi:hypothetical protein